MRSSAATPGARWLSVRSAPVSRVDRIRPLRYALSERGAAHVHFHILPP
jgi:hypothetical protein